MRSFYLLGILTFIYSFNAFSFELTASKTSIDIWEEAELLAGNPEDMGQRSLMFHKMYLDSEKKMPFALSVSHLTLAIERSIQFGNLAELKIPYLKDSLKKDTKIWREALQKLNKKMFKLTYFAYIHAKYFVEFGHYPEESEDTLEITNLTEPIRDTLVQIHTKRKKNLEISESEKNDYFDHLVRWEHDFLFQPELEKIFLKLDKPMQLSLNHIPSVWMEKVILIPFFKMRSSLQLACFLNPNKKLATKDFMDQEQRIQQAKLFFKELDQINYDPALFCYNDPYYVSMFKKEFFEDTQNYLQNLYLKLIHGEKPEYLLKRKKGIQKSIEAKTSSVRLLNSIKNSKTCSTSNLPFWKTYINKLLTVPEELLVKSSFEKTVIKNAIINLAYIDLFEEHEKRQSENTEIIPFSWLGSASFGSFSVGKQLLYSAFKRLRVMSKEFKKDKTAREYNQKIDNYMHGVSKRLAYSKSFLKTLARANQAVFLDIFWQFLVAEACGIEKTISLLKDSPILSDKNSIAGWEGLLNQNLLDGNLKLLRVEQEYILQDLLYNDKFVSMFAYMKTFNHYALPGAPGSEGELKTFDHYAKENNISNNLTNLESRMLWVNYLVENHALYFKDKADHNQLRESFEIVDSFSNKILDFYLD